MILALTKSVSSFNIAGVSLHSIEEHAEHSKAVIAPTT